MVIISSPSSSPVKPKSTAIPIAIFMSISPLPNPPRLSLEPSFRFFMTCWW